MLIEARLENATIVPEAAEIPGGPVSEFYLGNSSVNDEHSDQNDRLPDPLRISQKWENLLSACESGVASGVASLEGLAISQYAGLQSVREFAERDDEIFRSLAESPLGTRIKGLMDDPDSWREQLWSFLPESLSANMRQLEMLSGPGTMAKGWIGESNSWREQLCSSFVQQLGKGIGLVGTLAKSWTNESDSWKPWSSFAQYLPESIRQSKLLTGLSDGATGLSDLWYAIEAGVKLSKLPQLDATATDSQDDTDLEDTSL